MSCLGGTCLGAHPRRTPSPRGAALGAVPAPPHPSRRPRQSPAFAREARQAHRAPRCTVQPSANRGTARFAAHRGAAHARAGAGGIRGHLASTPLGQGAAHLSRRLRGRTVARLGRRSRRLRPLARRDRPRVPRRAPGDRARVETGHVPRKPRAPIRRAAVGRGRPQAGEGVLGQQRGGRASNGGDGARVGGEERAVGSRGHLEHGVSD